MITSKQKKMIERYLISSNGHTMTSAKKFIHQATEEKLELEWKVMNTHWSKEHLNRFFG